VLVLFELCEEVELNVDVLDVRAELELGVIVLDVVVSVCSVYTATLLIPQYLYRPLVSLSHPLPNDYTHDSSNAPGFPATKSTHPPLSNGAQAP
jgi:hypothetical protein